MFFGKFYDSGNIQVGTQRALILTNQIGLISSCTEHAVSIFFRIDGDSSDSQIMACPEDTHGYLPSVGNQDLLKFFLHNVPFHLKFYKLRYEIN